MNMHQFLAADEMEQIEAFWNAILVGEKEQGGMKVICRQLNDFYIEYKVKDEMYVSMRVFKNPDLLQPYLDKIEINLHH